MSTSNSKPTFEDAARAAQADTDEWEEPEPINAPVPEPAPYPVDALGDMGASAVRALIAGVEAAESLAANVVLSAINDAAHAHADMTTLSGRKCTLSLALFTVAQSGDRKSESEYWIFEEVRAAQKKRRSETTAEWREYKRAKAAWKPSSLAPEPVPPMSVRFILSDFTVEGLRKHFRRGHPAVIVLTAEAGRLTAGHAMSDDNRRKSAAAMSDLLDHGCMDGMRAGNEDGDDGVVDGCRACMHLLIQPGGAAEFLTDPVIIDQGLGSRLLVAWPKRPRRTGRATMDGARLEAVRAFAAKVALMVDGPLPTERDGSGKLALPCIAVSPEAVEVLRNYAADIEERMNEGGDLEDLQRYINKTAEQATKIAGSLFVFERGARGALPVEYATRGVAIAAWYVAERLRLFEGGVANPKAARIAKVLRRIVDDRMESVRPRDLVGRKVAGIRTAEEARAILDPLTAMRWLRRRPASRNVGRPPDIYDVHPSAEEWMREHDDSAKSAKSAHPRLSPAESQKMNDAADSADSADGRAPSIDLDTDGVLL